MQHQLATNLDVQAPDFDARVRRFFHSISNLLPYLTQNSASVVDYYRRYWLGQPISSSRAETTVNSLVNARMNKKRQMR